MKKLIAFDLDDTLAVTKSPISDQMSGLLGQLLNHFDVCIISGGKFELFKNQVIDRLNVSDKQLGRLHLMPTCGTRYLRYSAAKRDWQNVYAENLTPKEKQQITAVTERLARELGLWPAKPYGQVIEDRGSQISISMLGQLAPAQAKYDWFAKNEAKREKLRAAIAAEIPQFEVRSGGTTTIDITHIGIDKAYGMKKLMEQLNIKKSDILFLGDKLAEGGNDYPVKAIGIDCLEVDHQDDTARILQGILHVL